MMSFASIRQYAFCLV